MASDPIDLLPEVVARAFSEWAADPEGELAHAMEKVADDGADAARFWIAAGKHIRTGRMFASVRGRLVWDSYGLPVARVTAGAASNTWFAWAGSYTVSNRYGPSGHRHVADTPFVTEAVESVWDLSGVFD